MAEWYLHPIIIKNWDEKIDYVMFIDENGNANDIKNIKFKKENNIQINGDEKYFTITGCIFKKDDYVDLGHDISNLKNKYWKDGCYYDTTHKDIRYVCLHSREIRNHAGAFNENLINHQDFIKDLSAMLENVKCKIISISIDLEKYESKNEKMPVYDKAFDLLLERYIYATKNNRKGIIILESRGKKEDKLLLGHISKIIRKKGTKGIRKNELMKKIKGVFFNPKWYDNHSSTFVGLEIVDLFSYPIHQYVKYNKSNLAFDTLKIKINGYPNFKNKGVKIYP